MATCPECRRYFKTLEDEQNMHACLYCSYFPNDEEEEE